AASDMAAAPTTAAAESPAPPRGIAGWDVGSDGGDTGQPALRGLQAVQTPPPARLAYTVTVDTGTAPQAAGEATLEWRTGDDGYRLLLGGDSGVMGELESRGHFTDAGFVPEQVGGADAVSFDWAAARASFSRSGASVAVGRDGQDRASMLMRLAGIGLAGAHQLDGGIELQVAGAEGVARVRFENLGEETLASPLGPLLTVHLRQQERAPQPGTAGQPSKPAPRLEIWFAPALSWYPVQLRLTAADGSVVTQAISAIEKTPP
ncbi:MAG: hypothetical protein JWP59_1564, partial [Massilia sp.]|nr:hypothetical protein [Massilia sp.]